MLDIGRVVTSVPGQRFAPSVYGLACVLVDQNAQKEVKIPTSHKVSS